MESGKFKQTLAQFADAISGNDFQDSNVFRAAEVYLSSLGMSAAIPRAAKWFIDRNTVADDSARKGGDWCYQFNHSAANELYELVPRFVVLYGENRHCSLVGNSSACWSFGTLALLPQPSNDQLQQTILQQLFDDVVGLSEYESQPSYVCFRSKDLAPDDTLLTVRFEHEFPDTRLGHCMMRLEVDDNDAVNYWPCLDDDDEFNAFNSDLLTEKCEQIGLKHVGSLQLATFLSVLANANSREMKSWGGEQAEFFFDEGNLPYILNKLDSSNSE